METDAPPKLTVDPREGTVAGPGGTVRLEPKVMEVLELLAKHPGKVVSRTELLDTVWPGVVVTEHTLSRCIYQLRNELGKIGTKHGESDYNPIETLAKRGYRLLATIETSSADEVPPSRGPLSELRRRHVFGVASIYALIAWATTEAISHLIANIPAISSWSETLFATVFVVGFPVVMVLAWVFDAGPQGIQRRPPLSTARFLTLSIAAGLMIAATATLFYLLYPRGTGTIEDVHPAIASIAVLPFDNRSQDSENAYFADGIHDDLLMLLSKLGELKVVSRTSVEKFRDTEETLPQIGRTLGVDHVLEGAVQRVGDRVRVNVQLINASADDHVWAESYDRELTAANIFAIQSEVASAIADALQATLSLQDQERLMVVPTDNLAAYEAYLVGKQRIAGRTGVSVAEAADFFQQAIALDPDFALAYVGLADSYGLQVAYSGAAQSEMNAKAELAIDKALEIDGQLGEAFTSLGWLKQQRNDFEGAEAAYKKALQLNPNYATTYHWYGDLLGILGRTEEALEQHLKGIELDPVSGIINLHIGNDLEGLGRFDEALEQYRKTIEIEPSFSVTYATIADVYWFVYGDLAQAVPWYHRGLELDPENPVTPAWLGRLYLDLQDERKAEYWINRSIELAPESLDANYSMALLHLYRGDETKALEYATKVSVTNAKRFSVSLALLRDNDLLAGRYVEARERYEAFYPELLNEIDDAIDRTNYRAAIDLAVVLRATGDDATADRLLAQSLVIVHSIPKLGLIGHTISDTRILALQGKTEQALAALRQAVDQGWRNAWWYCLDRDPSLASIRDEPEFQAMMVEMKADMAVQLQRVQGIPTP